MTKLTLETIPAAIEQMAEKIENIEIILSEKQQPSDTGNKKYNLVEAAAYCRMAASTLRSYIYKRLIGGTKIGGAWLFTESDLEKFIADFRRPTKRELENEAFNKLNG